MKRASKYKYASNRYQNMFEKIKKDLKNIKKLLYS